MAVRIQCPSCGTSYMVMSGVELQPNVCPRCRTTFLPGAASRSPVPTGRPQTTAAPVRSPAAQGTAPGPRRQLLLGTLMILGAWLIGPGTVFSMWALSSRTDWVGVPMLSLVLALGTASAGWLLMQGRRLVARHAADVMSIDPRPPILLLRSFADDAMELERPHSIMFSNPVVTFEEVLADVCSWYGPVIAIGRPGEKLPPLGAARLWVDHHSWQQKVATLLRDCGAVVMIMGTIKGKDGLAWEVETICKLGLLNKLVLVVPPLKDEEGVKVRWQSYRGLTQGCLPPYQGGEMAATFDPSGGCSVDRQASGWGGFSRDRGTYKRLLHAAVRRLAGKPRRPWAVTLTRMIQAVTFGVIVAVIFLAVIFWKSEQDRKRHEQEDHWRRELYHSPLYR